MANELAAEAAPVETTTTAPTPDPAPAAGNDTTSQAVAVAQKPVGAEPVAEVDDGDVVESLLDDVEEAEVETGTELAPYAPPPEQELSEFGRLAVVEVDAYAVEKKLSADQRDSLVNDLWPRVLKTQQTRLVAADKEAIKASIQALGGREAYDPLVKAGQKVFRGLPQELQAGLREARRKNGELVALTPAFVRWIASLGNRPATNEQPKDNTAMRQEELQALDTQMRTDIDAYQRGLWRNSGKTGSERHLELLREGTNPKPKASPADVNAEERELRDFAETDPQLFEYQEWKKTGRTGVQRLMDIMAGRV